jgi:hypothetical protein
MKKEGLELDRLLRKSAEYTMYHAFPLMVIHNLEQKVAAER